MGRRARLTVSPRWPSRCFVQGVGKAEATVDLQSWGDPSPDQSRGDLELASEDTERFIHPERFHSRLARGRSRQDHPGGVVQFEMKVPSKQRGLIVARIEKPCIWPCLSSPEVCSAFAKLQPGQLSAR